jgi:hypothetical protein
VASVVNNGGTDGRARNADARADPPLPANGPGATISELRPSVSGRPITHEVRDDDR